YLTIVLGLYSQIVLGVIQVLSALVLFTYWKKFSSKTKEQLYIYWSITIIYGLCWLFDWRNFDSSFIIIFGVMVLPMCIAGYFLYIINSIKSL
ncbi:hypothetical protein, partial [Winogradskyella sp.]|uniref:hypothetical protein n=1 Tax=Winogradskyella sp. TaxID=1883156 RepID=UPI0025F89E4B